MNLLLSSEGVLYTFLLYAAIAVPALEAGTIPLNSFSVVNFTANGAVFTPSSFPQADLSSFDLTGGNDGSFLGGQTDFVWTAQATGTVSFNWAYSSLDFATWDWAGYLVAPPSIPLASITCNTPQSPGCTQLADTNNGGLQLQPDPLDPLNLLHHLFAPVSFSVNAGDTFGWYVGTFDNAGEPGTLSVLSLSFSPNNATASPEPSTFLLVFASMLTAGAMLRLERSRRLRKLLKKQGARIASITVVLCAGTALFGQVQNVYTGATITGQLVLARQTNLSQLGSSSTTLPLPSAQLANGPELPRLRQRFPPPPAIPHIQGTFAIPQSAVQTLSVSAGAANAGFNGLTHYDQRTANSGNQFSIEPPNPSIAVANGKVLEGVNNAVRVYSTSGTPLIRPVASNQLFGLAPAIDRTTNVYGVYTTDMRVFFDQDVSRWFVIQRAQDEDTAGNPLNQSHIYMAVSQTSDPTGVYNVYEMDTTNAVNPGCPCVDDYPQIGADRYGLYISANEYNTQSPVRPDRAVILAISKTDLAAGIATPTVSRFFIPYDSGSGFQFSIQPASTPPGASPVLTAGGLEFFVSSYAHGDSSLALWALTNTASLQSANPNMRLIQTTVPTLPYVSPLNGATQRPGTLTLGAQLETLDAGYFSDSRIISTSYAGGRLWVTLSSAVRDSLGRNLAGGLYAVFSPTFRGGILGATAPIKQGYIAVNNNHILRPAASVNAQGRGAIVFTLTGPDYYPTAAYLTIDTTPSSPSSIQIPGAGAGPEDGFSGYAAYGGNGVARWGDYATAVTSTDGSIWMVAEYIPNLPRTLLANWGTFVSQYIP